MNVVPRYDLPPGTELTAHERTIVVNTASDIGYEVVDKQSGRAELLPFLVLARLLQQPGIKMQKPITALTARAKLRLGAYKTVKALPQRQQEQADFAMAICFAMARVHAEIRSETNDPDYKFSQNKLNDIDLRERIARAASETFGKKIYTNAPAGGNRLIWQLHKGRRMNEIYNRYLNCLDAAASGETYDLAEALVPLDHLKGNRRSRITWLVRDLMTEAIDYFARETKPNSVANIHNRLVTLINQANEHRVANDLPKLDIPSNVTLSRHQDELYSPTEALVRDQGSREASRKRARGSTDIRALKIGELCEMDEVLLSLVVTAKVCGLWERLAQHDKAALESADEVIKTRLVLLVLLDVATRMPLAWVVSDQPRAEATLALLRMATRNKNKEKIRYGCHGLVADAVGLGMIKNDNGTGLRNAPVKAAILGSGGVSLDVRTYSPTDKPFIERHFGTLEAILLKILFGYTGRRPGELRGYDANKSGVLDLDNLYELLTCFYIDELPSMRHHGFGMWGRRPAEVYEEINRTRGIIAPIDPDTRRIHLCWEEQVTPTDEGVRVFSGIWFNSDELQQAIEVSKAQAISRDRRVSVFVDPDNLNEATVVLPRNPTPIRVRLQTSVFADMTINEVLNLVTEYRREDPTAREIYEDRLANIRQKRAHLLDTIGVEKGLSRSYQTRDEIKAKARALFRGARIVSSPGIPRAVAAGQITAEKPDGMIFNFSVDGAVIEASALKPGEGQPEESPPSSLASDPPEADDNLASNAAPQQPKRRKAAKSLAPTPQPATEIFSRPTTIRRLE